MLSLLDTVMNLRNFKNVQFIKSHVAQPTATHHPALYTSHRNLTIYSRKVII